MFGRNASGDEAEQAPLSIFQLLGLRKALRVRRELHLKIGVLGELVQRQVTGFAHGRQEQPPQRHSAPDFRDYIFFRRAEEIVAPGRIVECGRGYLQNLASHPADNLTPDSIDPHLGNGRTKALASLDKCRRLLKLALGQGSGAKHHFAEPILPVAARRKHQFSGIEKERLFHPSKDQLQLAGQVLGVNPMHEGEERVWWLSISPESSGCSAGENHLNGAAAAALLCCPSNS